MKKSLIFLSAFICIIIIYSPSLNGPFYLDSLSHLNISQLEFLKHLFADSDQTISKIGTRLLINLSFALNEIIGGHSPISFRIGNIIIHCACIVACYLFIKELFKIFGHKNKNYDYTAISIAIIWGLHPLSTTAVSYTIQRAASLSAFFIFMLFYYYLITRIELKNKIENNSPPSTSWSIKKITILGLLLTMAILSKETSILALGMLLLLEVFISGSLINFFKSRIVIFVSLATITLIPLGLAIYGHRHEIDMISNSYTSLSTYTHFTWYERLLTESRVLIIYLSKVLFPFFKYFYLQRNIEVSTNLISPISTILSILALMLLAISAFLTRKKNKLFSISIGCFFISQIIESTVIPLHIYFEHRMYLPSIFILISIFGILDSDIVSNAIKPLKKLSPTLLAMLLLYLSSQTYLRNEMYGDPIKFYLNDLEASETNLARCNLGNEYLSLNDYKNALPNFEKAIEIRPDHFGGYAGAGVCNLYLGNPKLAIIRIKKALNLGCENLQVYFELGLAKLILDDSSQTIQAWQDFLQYAIVINDNKFKNYFWVMTAALYQAKSSTHISDYENALRNLQEATKTLPGKNDDALILEFIIQSYLQPSQKFLTNFEKMRTELSSLNSKNQMNFLLSHFKINYENQSIECSKELINSNIMKIKSKSTSEKIQIAKEILLSVPAEDQIKFAYLTSEIFILVANLGSMNEEYAENLSITASALTTLLQENQKEQYTNPWYHLLRSLIPH